MNISIRSWRDSDAPQLAQVLSNPDIRDQLRDGLPFPYTVADAQNYIAAMRAEPFAFAVTADDVAVGAISAFRGENIHARTAELGYYLRSDLWGQGVMTAAVKQTAALVFAQSDILRIFAMVFARNAASCRVLEKAGFQLEGVLRQNAVKNGEVLDMKLYALLRPRG